MEVPRDWQFLSGPSALSGQVGLVDAGALRPCLYAGRPWRLWPDAGAYFAAPVAALVGCAVHRMYPGHTATDPAIHRVFWPVGLRSLVALAGGSRHCVDDLRERLSGRYLARLHRGDAQAAMGGIRMPGLHALADAAARDHSPG